MSNNYIECESIGDRNKTLSVEEYLNKIKPYLKDINNLKTPDAWKIQLTIVINFTLFATLLAVAINFISSKYNYCVMHSKTDNKEININDKADEVIEKLFKSLLNRYQNNL